MIIFGPVGSNWNETYPRKGMSILDILKCISNLFDNSSYSFCGIVVERNRNFVFLLILLCISQVMAVWPLLRLCVSTGYKVSNRSSRSYFSKPSAKSITPSIFFRVTADSVFWLICYSSVLSFFYSSLDDGIVIFHDRNFSGPIFSGELSVKEIQVFDGETGWCNLLILRLFEYRNELEIALLGKDEHLKVFGVS